jgi:DMSO/TMAO reductase YedYZ molybdopterin-dependent catalytic subunit
MRAPTVAALLMIMAGVAVHAEDPALRVEGATGRDGVAKAPLVLNMSDLAAMPRTSVRIRSRDGKEHTYEGVLLSELLKRAGEPLGEDLRGSLLSRYVLATAHDGYRVLFSLPELDPAFSDGKVIVADKLDGQPLPEREGPLRIVIPAEKREARWIRMVEKIEVRASPEPLR